MTLLAVRQQERYSEQVPARRDPILAHIHTLVVTATRLCWLRCCCAWNSNETLLILLLCLGLCPVLIAEALVAPRKKKTRIASDCCCTGILRSRNCSILSRLIPVQVVAVSYLVLLRFICYLDVWYWQTITSATTSFIFTVLLYDTCAGFVFVFFFF